MNTKQKNTALVAAIACGLISLPLPWMTLHTATFTPTGNSMPLPIPFPVANLTANAFNGTVSMPVTTPLWFLVCVAVAANALQLMRHSKVFDVPKSVEWIIAIIAVAWIGLPPLFGMFSGGVSLGIGWLMALVCAAVPLACLIIRTKESPQTTAGGVAQT